MLVAVKALAAKSCWPAEHCKVLLLLLSADPSRSGFASAVKRLVAEDEDIELLPGVQDLISGALGFKQARDSRRSMVDDEDDRGSDRSRGRDPIR